MSVANEQKAFSRPAQVLHTTSDSEVDVFNINHDFSNSISGFSPHLLKIEEPHSDLSGDKTAAAEESTVLSTGRNPLLCSV